MAKTERKPFDIEGTMRKNVEKLSALLESLELHGDGEHESTIQAVARVSQALTTGCAELRQHAKAERRAIESFPLEAILDYLRTLPLESRCKVAEDLTGARDEEALL